MREDKHICCDGPDSFKKWGEIRFYLCANSLGFQFGTLAMTSLARIGSRRLLALLLATSILGKQIPFGSEEEEEEK